MKINFLVAAMFATFSSAGLAAVSAEEAATLGTTLTPMGADRAGNASGSIPEWTGGITEVHPEFESGGHYPDPYAQDKPVLTIDAGNVAEHQAKLSPGQVALLKRRARELDDHRRDD